MCILLSCGNQEQIPGHKYQDTTNKKSLKDSVFLQKKPIEGDTVNYDYKYSFSNDTITQTLYVKKGTISKKYEVPEIVNFRLILSDKLGTHPEMRFEGVAELISANETFSENNNPDESDYFAADYVFNVKDCKLKIRLDIENYSACVVSTTCINLRHFLKGYPDFDVMKRASYKNE